MDKTTIIKTLRDMAKYPTVTLPRDTDALKSAADLLEQAEKHSEFIKHTVANTYDWSEWVCPDPESYLMKCCDCGLVHEAEFKVVRYKSETEREACDPVDDPNVQAVFRMRRSEQWSPEDTAYRPGGLAQECNNCGGTGDVSGEYPGAACPECSGKGVIEQTEKQEPVAKPITAHRAVFFMERFKREEKMLGPNEQAAVDFVIAMLEQAEQAQPVEWAKKAMELASDLSIESLRLGSYERKDTYENLGRASWQTVEIRQKREDVRERLRQHIYTSPPPRQRLTDEQLKPLIQKAMRYYGHNPDHWHLTAGAGYCLLARAIEAAHGIKEKNTRQDGNCKHCVNGCSACDARRQPNVLF